MSRGVILFFFLVCNLHLESANFVEVFGWKQINYEKLNEGEVANKKNIVNAGGFFFPDDVKQFVRTNKQFENSTANPSYIPYNNIPMSVNHYKGRLFITVPRRQPGIPFTLNYIDMDKVGRDHSPKLTPYPSVESNLLPVNGIPNQNRIISVYRPRIDACNRMWFVDTGLLEYPNNRKQVQRPSIWVVDLETDRRLHRFEIPSTVVEMGNGLVSITIDVDENSCDRAFAYIPDMANNALYVYSLKENRLWTFRHNFFYFEPIRGELSIAGQNFSWRDGIFSITLGNRQPDGSRTAYFHPMASTIEFAVSTNVLKNETNAARSYHGNDFKVLGSRGPDKQCTIHAFDSESEIIFYAEVMKNGVGCWNTKKHKFSEQNHGQVISDSKNMIYPSDLMIDAEGSIWVVTNSIPVFIYSRLNVNEVNFRVWRSSIYSAAKNTVCAN